MGVGKDVMLLLVLWHLLLLQADSKCQKSYTCRNFTLQFPFTYIDDPQCGLFRVAGCDSSSRETHPRLYIGASTSAKYILGQPSENKLLIHDFLLETLLESPDYCYSFLNVSLPQSPSVSFTISPNITFFTCFNKTTNDQIQDYFQTYRRQHCQASTLYYKTPASQEHAPEIPENCSLAQLPIKSDENSTKILELLSPSFSLEWNVSEDCNQCYRRGGQCLADNKNDFYCKSKTAGNRLKVILLASLIPGVAILVLLSGCIFWVRKKKMGGAYLLSRNLSYDPSSKSDIEDGSFNFGVPIFSYTELVDATGNFDPSKELGDGGFGTVYYGKLRDGREVAIKRLYEHNYRRVEQFLNEIKILTSLRHPNLVSLYGCTSRRSRELLLVYEYIPNGTVADHLHGERASEVPLTWPVRMSIARETATALAYLHKSDIIHRDVKTNNILLDSNF